MATQAREPKPPRRPWGDPKWAMRRAFVIGVLLWCAGTFWLAMALPLSAEKITALSTLLGSLSVIVMPIVVSYMGIAEAGSVITALKSQPGTQVTQTTEIKRTESPDAAARANQKGEGA